MRKSNERSSIAQARFKIFNAVQIKCTHQIALSHDGRFSIAKKPNYRCYFRVKLCVSFLRYEDARTAAS